MVLKSKTRQSPGSLRNQLSMSMCTRLLPRIFAPSSPNGGIKHQFLKFGDLPPVPEIEYVTPRQTRVRVVPEKRARAGDVPFDALDIIEKTSAGVATKKTNLLIACATGTSNNPDRCKT